MSDIDLEAMAVAFWIRDNDRMLISAGAIAEIDKAVQAARAAGAAAERARCVAVIEAELQRRELVGDDPDVLSALGNILRAVRQ